MTRQFQNVFYNDPLAQNAEAKESDKTIQKCVSWPQSLRDRTNKAFAQRGNH